MSARAVRRVVGDLQRGTSNSSLRHEGGNEAATRGGCPRSNARRSPAPLLIPLIASTIRSDAAACIARYPAEAVWRLSLSVPTPAAMTSRSTRLWLSPALLSSSDRVQ